MLTRRKERREKRKAAAKVAATPIPTMARFGGIRAGGPTQANGFRYRIQTSYNRESGWWVGRVPALPGCLGQGKTREAANKDVRAAVEDYLRIAHVDGWAAPPPDIQSIFYARS